MTNQHHRLQQARIAAGFAKSAASAAAAFGWNENTYRSNENGNAPYSYEQAKVYARAFRVYPSWLYDDDYRGPMKPGMGKALSITGHVGAGHEGHFDTDHVPGDGHEIVNFDADEIELVLDVQGESMLPRYRPGNLVFFGYRHDDPRPLIGKDVMAQVSDGRKLLKQLERGSNDNVWTLRSVNPLYEDIRDVKLDWVLPVKWVRIS